MIIYRKRTWQEKVKLYFFKICGFDRRSDFRPWRMER